MKRNSCLIVVLAGSTAALAQSPPQGEWEPWIHFGPSETDRTVAVHLIHTFDGVTGKIIALTFEFDSSVGAVCSGTSSRLNNLARLWTPPAMGAPSGDPGVFEAVPLCARSTMFCAGHSALADGMILVTGGGLNSAGAHKQGNLFDPTISPSGASWNNPQMPPDMAGNRWYPTCTTLGDGTVLVTSGNIDGGDPMATPPVPPARNVIPELYYPPDHPLFPNSFEELPTAELEQQLYPYMFLLPTGDLFDASPGMSRILHSSNWTWGPTIAPPPWPVDPPPPPPRSHGSAVMYEPGKIMMCGGRGPDATEDSTKAVPTTWTVDLNQNSATWLLAGSMQGAATGQTPGRRNHNLVVLPDGKILAVGGNKTTIPGSGPGTGHFHPVRQAEIFDPASGTWAVQPASHASHPRMYHSTAMLLQDGRVVSAGANNNPTAQIFRPPYITSGAPRPIITDAPLYMQWGEEYTIEYSMSGGPAVTKACLIRLGSVTHGFDQDQRRVPLTITGSGEGPQPWITVAAPANGNLAPPGYYTLWILNEYGTNQFAPCELAAYVQIGP